MTTSIYDIKITIKAFPDEQAKIIALAILTLIKEVEKKGELDLSLVDEIIIADDFGAELAGIDTGSLKGDTNFTNLGYATAAGKNVHILKNNKFSIKIVLDKSFGSQVVSLDPNEMSFPIHALHHELCHAHDMRNKMNCFNDYWTKPWSDKSNVMSNYLRPVSTSLWSEYIANYFSYETTEDFILSIYFEEFNMAIPRTKEIVDKALNKYYASLDLKNLVDEAMPHIRFLALSAAYGFGYLNKIGGDLVNIVPKLDETIKDSYFEIYWDSVSEGLLTMHKTYPNWKVREVYEPLDDAVDLLFREFGFQYSDLPDGSMYLTIS